MAPSAETKRATGPRLRRLLDYLARDPDNATLLADAADAAVEEGDFETADRLLAKLESRGGLTPALLNLRGIVSLAAENYAQAEQTFAALMAASQNDATVRFNLAWARAKLGLYQEAADLLDDATVAASPRGPSLKIHAMHHLGLYEEGLEQGARLAQRFPDDRSLMGALATLAMDADRPDLASQYAARAGDDGEGLAVRGLLALSAYNTDEALSDFDSAIAKQPRNPRAWIGKGLGQLARGDAAGGAEAIDRGAELFQSHLGSWIAAGWAHFACGDRVAARARFERALALDENFAESHGALAVLDIMDGNVDSARRRTEIALRLDRNCFGAALAATLLLQQAGRPDAARKIVETAMSAPIGPNGTTLLQAMMGFGLTPRR